MSIYESVVDRVTQAYNRVRGEAKAFDWTHQTPAPASAPSLDAVQALGVEPTQFQRVQAAFAEDPARAEAFFHPPSPAPPPTPYDIVGAIADAMPGYRPLRRAFGTAMGVGTGNLTARNAPGVGPYQVDVGQPSPLHAPGTIAPGGPGFFESIPKMAAAPAAALAKGIGELPNPMYGSPLTGTIERKLGGGKKVKNADPATQFVMQSVPYVLAPEAGMAVFLASLPETTKEQVGAYQRGEITKLELAKNMGLTLGPLVAPALLKYGIKGAAAARRFAKTPEGRQLVKDALTQLSQEGGGGAPLNPHGEPVKPGESPGATPALPGPEGNAPATPPAEGNSTPPAPETSPLSAQAEAVLPEQAPPVREGATQDVAVSRASEGQAAPAAGEPPTPVNIGPTLVEKVRQNAPIRESQAGPRSQQLAAKAARIRAVREQANLTPAQRAAALGRAGSGEMYRADFTPLQITAEQHAAALESIAANPNLREWEYFRLVGTYDGDIEALSARLHAGALTEADKIAIGKLGALDRLRVGLGLRGYEETLMAKAFGPEMADALKNRGADALAANIENAMQTPRTLGPTEPAVVMLGADKFLEGPQGVQAGVDIAVNQAAQTMQRTGTGLYGISTRPRSLKAGIGQAMQPSRSLGPVEQTRVIKPFSNATAAAADEAVTAAVDAELLAKQLKSGAEPDWHYQQRIAAEAQTNGALANPDPLKRLNLVQKSLRVAGRGTASGFQLWRSWKTAFDNSFTFRQGWKLAASNVKEFAGSWKRSWQVMLSRDPQKVLASINAEVQAMPHFELGQRLKRKLEFQGPQNRAEEFLSPSTEKIPGLNRSEAAFNAGGNYIRGKTFESNIATWERANGSPITDQAAQLLVDNINNATLRGNIRLLGNSANTAGQTFFSIRGKASLPQFILDSVRTMRPGADPVARRLFATRLGGWLALNASLLYAAKWVGSTTGLVDADLNPYSPTFGRVKGAGMTYDLWTGYQPVVRMVIAMGTGRTQKPGYLEPQGVNRTALVPNYIRGQLSPGAGTVYDLTFGRMRDYQGRDLTDPKQLAAYGLDQVDPLFFSDVFQAWQSYGIIGAGIGGSAAFSGVGVQPAIQDEQAKIDKANARVYIAKSGYDNAEDELWKVNVRSGNFPSGFGSFNDFRDALIKEVSKDGADPMVAKAFVDSLPALKRYNSQLAGYRAHLRENDPQLTKALLTAGVLQPSASNVGALAVPQP